ncbi:hypothetical protein HKCCE2091_19110 [Rhodobacterales bacterium HKCCE2091]|nr:hypothetical protein [Rhodobacterales bacterium HKCCE2091]
MSRMTLAAAAAAATLALSQPLFSATAGFSGMPGVLVDAGTATVPVEVTAADIAGGMLSGLTLSLGISVCGGFFETPLGPCARPISHTANRDLSLWLVSPAGTRVDLVFDATGPEGATYGDQVEASSAVVLFDDAAADPVGGDEIASGSFRPATPLSALVGEGPLGTWVIGIGDLEARSPKRLDSYVLTLETGPAAVPVPGGLALAATGLAALGLSAAWRRRRA